MIPSFMYTHSLYTFLHIFFQYTFKTEEDGQIDVYMNVIDRASSLDMTQLVSYIQRCKEKRLSKRKEKPQKNTATKIEKGSNARHLVWT